MLIFFVCILVDLSQGFCYSGLTLEAGGLDRLTKCASPPDMFLLNGLIIFHFPLLGLGVVVYCGLIRKLLSLSMLRESRESLSQRQSVVI